MKVGIIGCGAIANIITSSIVPEDNGIELAYFFDKDIERAENIASLAYNECRSIYGHELL